MQRGSPSLASVAFTRFQVLAASKKARSWLADSTGHGEAIQGQSEPAHHAFAARNDAFLSSGFCELLCSPPSKVADGVAAREILETETTALQMEHACGPGFSE